MSAVIIEFNAKLYLSLYCGRFARIFYYQSYYAFLSLILNTKWPLVAVTTEKGNNYACYYPS